MMKETTALGFELFLLNRIYTHARNAAELDDYDVETLRKCREALDYMLASGVRHKELTNYANLIKKYISDIMASALI